MKKFAISLVLKIFHSLYQKLDKSLSHKNVIGEVSKRSFWDSVKKQMSTVVSRPSGEDKKGGGATSNRVGCFGESCAPPEKETLPFKALLE